MKSYFQIGADEQLAVLQYGSRQLQMPENILEKDIWLCWVLEQIFKMPSAPKMAFKGGTSLSKVFGLIERFSEDVDITLDYRNFEDFELFDPKHSKTKLRKYSDRLKKAVKDFSTHQLMPYLQEQLDALPQAQGSKCQLRMDSSGEKVWLYYPSVSSADVNYLREGVLLELGGRNTIDPNQLYTVKPYVNRVVEELSFPCAEINVLAAERTFWEKATLIHVACQRDIKKSTSRLVRHWYDLVMLYNSDMGTNAITDIDLLKDVVAHKNIFFQPVMRTMMLV